MSWGIASRRPHPSTSPTSTNYPPDPPASIINLPSFIIQPCSSHIFWWYDISLRWLNRHWRCSSLLRHVPVRLTHFPALSAAATSATATSKSSPFFILEHKSELLDWPITELPFCVWPFYPVWLHPVQKALFTTEISHFQLIKQLKNAQYLIFYLFIFCSY